MKLLLEVGNGRLRARQRLPIGTSSHTQTSQAAKHAATGSSINRSNEYESRSPQPSRCRKAHIFVDVDRGYDLPRTGVDCQLHGPVRVAAQDRDVPNVPNLHTLSLHEKQRQEPACGDGMCGSNVIHTCVGE